MSERFPTGSQPDGLITFLATLLVACHGVSNSSAPLDHRVDAFIAEHELNVVDCGTVVYRDECEAEDQAAVDCFAKSKGTCATVRLDTADWTINADHAFFADFIQWRGDVTCQVQVFTYSTLESTDDDDRFDEWSCATEYVSIQPFPDAPNLCDAVLFHGDCFE